MVYYRGFCFAEAQLFKQFQQNFGDNHIAPGVGVDCIKGDEPDLAFQGLMHIRNIISAGVFLKVTGEHFVEHTHEFLKHGAYKRMVGVIQSLHNYYRIGVYRLYF